MKTGFTLCPACTAQFQALRFNPNAACHSVLLPFGSIIWDDELPARDERHFLRHRECNFSVIRVFALRKEIWHLGNNGEPSQDVWLQARAVMPEWPGFHRMSLNQEQKDALKFCEQETEELMDDFRRTSSVFALTDEGGGAASFKAFPK